ncbi:hypothetical protein AM228_22090 [Planktothricoides sp. SR001]|nr:hypothetical protein AM228_22090 [Planktothricoides sp. SR001]
MGVNACNLIEYQGDFISLTHDSLSQFCRAETGVVFPLPFPRPQGLRDSRTRDSSNRLSLRSSGGKLEETGFLGSGISLRNLYINGLTPLPKSDIL